jgi:NAD(P)-dependent dehydrogenase (short-subunit alcohol dehydrogenase family)
MAYGADLAHTGAGRQLVEAVTHELGPVDIVVLNASAQIRRAFVEISEDEFDLQIDVNLRATFEILQSILPSMAERGWGRVLTIGSVQQVRPNPNLAVYAATKSAQANLALNLAKQYAGRGVTVNNLAPGLIDTDRNTDLKRDEAAYERLLKSIPVGRAGDPEDCAWPALLLCSDAGRYITGADLLVDGGLHLP